MLDRSTDAKITAPLEFGISTHAATTVGTCGNAGENVTCPLNSPDDNGQKPVGLGDPEKKNACGGGGGHELGGQQPWLICV